MLPDVQWMPVWLALFVWLQLVFLLHVLPVHLPESGLRQSLLNLLLNSADAFEGKAGEIVISCFVIDNFLTVQVRDNGHGFAQEWLDYGIRPFRTSRERGTGLGLAMVQRFVKNNNGTLTLNNDKGAIVRMMLPNINGMELH